MKSNLLAGICFAVTLTNLFGAAMAETPSAAKAPGTITVDYEFTSVGKKADSVDSKEWNVRRVFNLTADLAANAPIPYPSMQKLDATQQQAEASRLASVQSAAAGMGSIMAGAEQIMKICGDDEACIEREVIKLGAATNPADVAGARKDVAAASAMPANNYQDWLSTRSTSTFQVSETIHERTKDPICQSFPGATCTIDTTVAGKGNVPVPPAGVLAAEMDLAKNTLTLMLPLPVVPVQVPQTVKSDHPEYKNGTTLVYRKLGAKSEAFTVDCAGSCRGKSGQRTVDMVDEETGAPGKLVIKWAFTAK